MPTPIHTAIAALALVAAAPAAAQTGPSWGAAVVSGDIAAIQRMLDTRQATIETPVDGEGNTALHIAADRCNVPLIRMLLARGAQGGRNKWNDTPLVIATVKCGGGSEAVVALGGAVAAPAPSAAALGLYAGERSEPNTLACPVPPSDQRILFDQLAVNDVRKNQATGWAVKLTQAFPTREPVPFNDGSTGFMVDILLPTVTIRGLVFRGAKTDSYDGPIRRFSLCGMTFLVKSSWGHPYIHNAITIETVAGAAGGL